MIQNNDKLQKILNNIIRRVQIVRNDLNFNEKTSKDFMIRNLSKAQDDIEVLIDYANVVKGKKNDR